MYSKKNFILLFLVSIDLSLSPIDAFSFDFRSFESPIKSQAQVACQANNIKANGNYVCTKMGEIVCLFGWKNESSLCTEPVCSQECDKMHGKCTGPNTCTCEVGWESSSCDECVRLPGCRNGFCNKPYECQCEAGWSGTFCEEPICKKGCINGFCSSPGECLCEPGWKGGNCTVCEKLPGCSVHGDCSKPLECNCEQGWEGNFCQSPICHPQCHPDNGFCRKPNECWCKIGWEGLYCDECRAYPGCKGRCNKPWECICSSGQSGPLCDSSEAVYTSMMLTSSTQSPSINRMDGGETLKMEATIDDVPSDTAEVNPTTPFPQSD